MLALALAIAPVVALIWYFLHLDRFNKEPVKMLLLTFLFGILSVIPALGLEMLGGNWLGEVHSHVKLAIQAFIVIALSEEAAKYFFLRKFVYKNKHFDEPFDGIVYALMISLGFAAIENVLYVLEGGVGVAVLRMFTAVPAHASFAVLMGFWVGKAKKENKPLYNWIGLFSAVLFHGAYDFFLIGNLFEGQLIGALVSLAIAIFLSRRAIKIHLKHKETITVTE